MDTALIQQIVKSLHGGQASASWLIVGPRGVGKRDFTEALAQQLTGVNAPYNPNVQWLECNFTETAKKDIQKAILAGQKVEDITDLARKTEITVDDVRDGCQFLALKSDKLKILVIDLADEMNENAQNALLKTLEEPYPNTLILLLCENVGKLLPTILSRCQMGRLKELSQDEMVQQLQKKHPEKPLAELQSIAELSSGSMGIAQDLIASDGLKLYSEIKALCVPIKNFSISALSVFNDKVSSGDVDFEVVKYLISAYIAQLAKDNALQSLENAYDFAELYQAINAKWRDQQILNLDKKQTLFSVFYAIGEALS
ncbi:MAG: AAA family ATPase [Alphaproteobacteria bacterium]|nr:AAA family ATPase [Alphaproteobacteria bacterium]